MSTRWTIALVLVFAGLTAGYWWTGRLADETERRTIEARRVFTAEAAQVETLGIERAGEPLVEATRAESGWDIALPHPYIAANQSAWDRLAQTIVGLTNERPIESQLDDASVYGMDSPSLRVFVNLDGALTQVDFGRLDPTQSFRYARTADEGLFLAPVAIYEELNKSLLDLRDRRIFVPGEEGFGRIAYHAAPTETRPEAIDMTFQRQPDGQWMMTHPIQAAASSRKLNDLAAELALLRGRSYVDAPENLSDYGLANPFASVSAGTPGGELQTLHLGWIDDSQEDAGLFVQLEGHIPVVVVDASIVTHLPDSVEDMREDRLFTREASQLTGFTYRDDQWTMRFEIGPDGGWRMTEPAVDDTDQLAVSAYIAILKQIEAQSFPEPAVLPERRITLDFEFAGGLPSTQIALGGPVPGTDPAEIYAWQDNGTLVTLPARAWPLLRGEPFKFRDRSLFEFDVRDAEAVELTVDGTPYRFEVEAGRWRVVEPAGYYFESQDDARAILEAMSGVKAVAVVSPHGGNEIHGLDTPAVEAQVWVRGPDGTARSAGHLHVGNLATEQGRHRFARSAGKASILLIDQAFVDDLRAALEGVVLR